MHRNDDETYIKEQTPIISPTWSFFYRQVSPRCSGEVPEEKVDKFAKKYLEWQAISLCGKFSKPHIMTGTINCQIYKEECILLPFLRSHEGETLLWPDLATVPLREIENKVMRSQRCCFCAEGGKSAELARTLPDRKILGEYEGQVLENKRCLKTTKIWRNNGWKYVRKMA